MAAVLAGPTEYNAKCARLATLRNDIKARVDEAETLGKFSPDNKQKFDALSAEFKTLQAEVLGADAVTAAKQCITDMDATLNAGRAMPPRDPVELEADLAKKRDEVLSGRGANALRFYNLHGPNSTREARLKNRKSAYLSGLSLLSQTGLHSEWAQNKLRQEGYTASGRRIEGLATISPFMGEDGNQTGGYLVFPEFEATLIDLKEQYGVLEREAYKMPMTSDTLNIPRRAGGTTVYYPEENTLIPASAMAFDKVMLIAKKYAQLALWSSELDEDSVIAFTDLLTAEMAYQFAKAEDFNGAQGDGTSAYAGVVGFLYALINGKNGISPTASLFTMPTGNSTTATFLAQTSAYQMGQWNRVVGALPVYAEGRAKWYMHKTVFWGLIAPTIEALGGNIAIYLTSGIPLKYLGYDVEVMQSMPTFANLVGTTATSPLSMAAVLGDIRMTCFMGNRRGMRMIKSNERFMEYDQLAVQVSQHVAINNVVGDSVAPLLQAGPMVGLQLSAT